MVIFPICYLSLPQPKHKTRPPPPLTLKIDTSLPKTLTLLRLPPLNPATVGSSGDGEWSGGAASPSPLNSSPSFFSGCSSFLYALFANPASFPVNSRWFWRIKGKDSIFLVHLELYFHFNVCSLTLFVFLLIFIWSTHLRRFPARWAAAGGELLVILILGTS